MQCLKCERAIVPLEEFASGAVCLDGGGTLRVSFGYGSVHDQGPPAGPVTTASPRLERLRTCSEVRAYVCDACYEAHADLFEGFVIAKPPPPKIVRIV